MVISAFRKLPFPEWLILKTKNKHRCTLVKVIFIPWGTSFLWAEPVACAESGFMPACSWFPAEQPKSLLGQAFTLQDPGLFSTLPNTCGASCRLLSFISLLEQRWILPAPLHLCPGVLPVLGLGTPLGANCIHRTSYHYKKHCLLIISAAPWEGFPPQTCFLVWMGLELMGAGGSGYPDICFLTVILMMLLNSGGRRVEFFCLFLYGGLETVI